MTGIQHTFIKKTLVRRKRNRIAAIQNDVGHWLFDNEEIKRQAVQFYQSLYTQEASDFQPYSLTNCFLVCDNYVLRLMQGPDDDMEIRNTIFSMKPLKAPGTDGLHAIFY